MHQAKETTQGSGNVKKEEKKRLREKLKIYFHNVNSYPFNWLKLVLFHSSCNRVPLKRLKWTNKQLRSNKKIKQIYSSNNKESLFSRFSWLLSFLLAIESYKFHSWEIPESTKRIAETLFKLITNHLQQKQNRAAALRVPTATSSRNKMSCWYLTQWRRQRATDAERNYISTFGVRVALLLANSIPIELNLCFSNKTFSFALDQAKVG